MNADEITALLQAEFPDCEVSVEELAPGKVLVTLVGERFAGLRRVKREQQAAAPLRDAISAGHVHAVTYRVKTPQEVAEQGR